MSLYHKILNSSLFKASGIYTFGTILNSAIPFFLLPILTRYLTPEEYGIVSMFSILLSIVGVFTGLSVHGAIHRVFYDRERFNFKEYIFNCLIILFVSSFIVLLIVEIFKDYISQVSGVPANWLWIVVVVSFFQFAILSLLSIYQGQMQAKKYIFIQITQSLMNMGLSLLFVVVLLMHWQGRIIGQALAVVIIGILALIILFNKWTFFKLNLAYIKHTLNFGIPLIPHTIGGMLMVMTDRIIINNLLGLKEVGVYTVGLQIGMIIGILADSFNKAYAPWLFSKLNENNYRTKIKIVKFTYLYFVLISLFAISLGLCSPYILKYLVGNKFTDSSSVILWIALGNAFSGMYFMVVNYIFYVYKTQKLAIITLLSSSLNVPLTYLLTKYSGIVGAAQSYMLINFITFIFVWFYSIKSYTMPWFKWKY